MPPSHPIRERLWLVAIALWVPTALGLAWHETREQEPPGEPGDTRIRIELGPEEHTTMQRTMRANVDALHAILEAWAVDDRAAMATAARSVSRNRPSGTTPSLRNVLPPEWTALGRTVHTELDALADDLATGLPATEIPGRLARVTAACVACHQTFAYRRVEREAADD